MRTFNVNVNGVLYQVEVEEIAAGAPAGKGENINAPMPGNILDVRVANGQAVTAGQILMILEAMKMENEIIAPCAGTVSNLSVQKGSTVSSGQLLCSIG